MYDSWSIEFGCVHQQNFLLFQWLNKYPSNNFINLKYTLNKKDKKKCQKEWYTRTVYEIGAVSQWTCTFET